jgi:ABC-type antimicrobial peptide transport system permease subunit
LYPAAADERPARGLALVLTAIVASLGPALRATRVDPIASLRAE